MQWLVDCFPENVFVASNPVDITWGDVSILKAVLQCMENLLARSDKWKYYVHLTGEEFLLVTNLELVTSLKNLKGANLVEGWCMLKLFYAH